MDNNLPTVLRLAAAADTLVSLVLLGLIVSGTINLPVFIPLLLLLAAVGLFIASLRM